MVFLSPFLGLAPKDSNIRLLTKDAVNLTVQGIRIRI